MVSHLAWYHSDFGAGLGENPTTQLPHASSGFKIQEIVRHRNKWNLGNQGKFYFFFSFY